MDRNQIALDELFKEAAANHKCFVSKIEAGSRNNFVDNELSLALTALSKGLRTQLEILKILSGESKEIIEPS